MHLVNVGLVQLDVLGHILAQLFQLLDGADHMDVAAFAGPDGQGRAPIALPGQAPVDDVLDEVAHAALFDVLGHPVHRAVDRHQFVAHRGHADEPGGAGVVDERGVAPPAEGVVVGVQLFFVQQAPLLQILDDLGVGLLHEQAGPGGALIHAALGVHQLHKGQVVFPAHPGVVLAESRGDVHDAGAVLHGDVIVGHHPPGRLFGLHKAVERLIFHAGERPAGEGLGDFGLLGVFLAQDLGHQGPGHDEGLALQAELHIFGVRVHAQAHVAGQRPGRGGPGQEIGLVPALDLEAREHRVFADLLIALGNLMGGQGGAAPGAIGHHLVALVQQALVVYLL